MSGKPHSPNPSQQRPYIVQTKNGKVLDQLGKEVLRDSHEAHIPIKEFTYRG